MQRFNESLYVWSNDHHKYKKYSKKKQQCGVVHGCRSERVCPSPCIFHEVRRVHLELQTAHPGRNENVVIQQCRLVYESRELFFHTYRGAAAPDIAGVRKQFLHMQHLTTLVAGDPCREFQVNLDIAGHHADEQTVPVSLEYQGLEDLTDVLSELRRHMLHRKVILGILIWDEFVSYACGIQKPGCVGLDDCGHFYCWCAGRSRSSTTLTGLKVSSGTSTNRVFQSLMAPFQRPGSSSALSSRPFLDLLEMNPVA